MVFVEMAFDHPPVGLNIFMVQAITNDNIWTIAKGNLPFVLMMLLIALILFAVPEICLWLPNLLSI